MFYCKNCVSPNTRPRLEFNAEGQCNACTYHERVKSEIDWKARWDNLERICDQFRRKRDQWDVLVPLSGGKDGSYVAYRLKYDLGMQPLCVTFASPIPTQIGRRNLQNFLQCGYDHLMITPDFEAYRRFNKEAFIKMGMPKQGFVTGISSAIMKVALKFDLKFVCFGEQGETVYGGKETSSLQRIDQDFLKNIYYEGQDPSEYGYWWELPTAEQLENVYMTWWSLFEDWDPEHHAKVAKDKCGLEMLVGGSIGTFTNYAQLDDAMQDLHTYLQYVKFGFGRCTSDASIEIRRGRMTREQGVAVVNKLDGTFPWEYLDAYLGYFQMKEENFWYVIDSFVNHDVLKLNPARDGRPWILREPCV